MATETPQAPGKNLPAVALILGWLIPGAGHMFLRKWIRGGLLFASVLGMFLIGIGLHGKIFSPNTGDLLDLLGFAGQIGLGLLYILARVAHLGAPASLTTINDYGKVFLVVAGLLNVIAAVDAHSLASGRKASK